MQINVKFECKERKESFNLGKRASCVNATLLLTNQSQLEVGLLAHSVFHCITLSSSANAVVKEPQIFKLCVILCISRTSCPRLAKSGAWEFLVDSENSSWQHSNDEKSSAPNICSSTPH